MKTMTDDLRAFWTAELARLDDARRALMLRLLTQHYGPVAVQRLA